MSGFSLGTTWEDMMAFLRRESGLLIPVAMATFAVGAVLMGFGLPETAMSPGTPPPLTPRLLLLVPAMLLLVLGNLAISLIVLVPGISVAEALRRAVLRMPVVLLVWLLLMLAVALAAFLMILLLTVGLMVAGGNPAAAASPVVVMMMAAMTLVSVPLLILSPLVAVEPVRAPEAIRRALALARRKFGRLLITLVTILLLSVTMTGIAKLALASVGGVLALALGNPGLFALLGDLIVAAIGAVISMGGAVYVALVYRKLAE